MYFVSHFIRGADMQKYHKERGHLSEDEVKFYALQLVLSVGYLHSKKIAHRNLKLENILLDQEGYVNLIDFGLAKKLE